MDIRYAKSALQRLLFNQLAELFCLKQGQLLLELEFKTSISMTLILATLVTLAIVKNK